MRPSEPTKRASGQPRHGIAGAQPEAPHRRQGAPGKRPRLTPSYARLVPRIAGLVRLLRRLLCASEPLGAALALDPGLAERTDTDLHDHDVADVLLAIDQLVRALDELADDSPDSR